MMEKRTSWNSNLAPGKPPQRKTSLRSSARMKRTPMKSVNRERKTRLYERNFGDYAEVIRSRPCDGCGMPAPSDPAHARARGMGGCKGSKRDLVSLCFDRPGRPGCHALYDTNLDAFTERTGMTKDDVIELARRLWEEAGAGLEDANGRDRDDGG